MGSIDLADEFKEMLPCPISEGSSFRFKCLLTIVEPDAEFLYRLFWPHVL